MITRLNLDAAFLTGTKRLARLRRADRLAAVGMITEAQLEQARLEYQDAMRRFDILVNARIAQGLA